MKNQDNGSHGHGDSSVNLDEIEWRLTQEMSGTATEIDQLRLRNAELRARNAELRTLAEAGWQSEMRLKQLHIIESDMADELSELRAELALKTASFEAKERELLDTQKKSEIKLASSEQEKALLAQELDQAVQQQVRVEAVLRQTLQGAETRAEALRLETLRLRAEIDDLKHQIDQREKRILECLAEITTAGEENEAARAKLQAELNETREALWKQEIESKKFKSMSQDLDEELGELREVLASKNRTQDSVAAEIEKLRSENAAYRNRFDEYLNEFGSTSWELENKLSKVCAELEASNASNARLSSELSAAQMEIESKSTELSVAQTEIESKSTELSAALVRLDAKTKELEESKTRRYALLAEIESVQEDLFCKSADLVEAQQNTEELESKLESAHREIALKETALENSGVEIRRLEEKATGFEGALTVWQTKALSLETKLGKLRVDLQSLTRERDEALARVVRFDLDRVKLQERFTEVQRERDLLRQELVGKNEEMTKLSGSNVKLQIELGQVRIERDQIENKRIKLSKLQKRIEQLVSRIATRNRELETGLCESKAREDELVITTKDLQQSLGSLQTQYSQMKSELDQQKAVTTFELERQSTEVRDLKDQSVELMAELSSARESSTRKDRLLQSRDLQIVNLRRKLEEQSTIIHKNAEASDQELEAARKTITLLGEETKELQKRLAEIQTIQASTNFDFSKQEASIKIREEQLRNYAESLSRGRAEALHMAKALADELRAARTLNPLKDCLTLTEFELSKMEVQLKTTPTVSMDRARHERSFKQLIEQRDFLRATIAKSQEQVDQQAKVLASLLSTGALAALPPRPPGLK